MVSGKGKGKGRKATAKGGKSGKGGDANDDDKGDLTKLLAAGAGGGSPGRAAKSGAGKGGAPAAPADEGGLNAAKTVQELEAELLIGSLSKKGGRGEEADKRQSSSKQHLEAKGSHCEVRKHSDMGCAVITMESASAREVVLKLAAERTPATGNGEKEKRPQVQIGEFTIQMRPHYNKTHQVDVKTDIFVAWGRQNEKRSPLAASAIAEAFDNLFRQAQPTAAQVYGQQVAMAMHPQMMQPAMGACPHPVMAQGMMPAMPYMAMQTPQFGMVHPQQVAQVGMAAQAQVQQQLPMQAAQQAQPQPQQAGQLPQPGAQPGAATPPTRAPDAGANGMRADAPAFAFAPGQAAAAGPELSGYGYADPSAYFPTPERKVMTIVDPRSGEPIKVDPPKPLPGFAVPKASGHRPLSIIDPVSGSKVDTIGMNFTPPKTAKLSIIDPSCGAAIKT